MKEAFTLFHSSVNGNIDVVRSLRFPMRTPKLWHSEPPATVIACRRLSGLGVKVDGYPGPNSLPLKYTFSSLLNAIRLGETLLRENYLAALVPVSASAAYVSAELSFVGCRP